MRIGLGVLWLLVTASSVGLVKDDGEIEYAGKRQKPEQTDYVFATECVPPPAGLMDPSSVTDPKTEASRLKYEKELWSVFDGIAARRGDRWEGYDLKIRFKDEQLYLWRCTRDAAANERSIVWALSRKEWEDEPKEPVVVPESRKAAYEAADARVKALETDIIALKAERPARPGSKGGRLKDAGKTQGPAQTDYAFALSRVRPMADDVRDPHRRLKILAGGLEGAVRRAFESVAKKRGDTLQYLDMMIRYKDEELRKASGFVAAVKAMQKEVENSDDPSLRDGLPVILSEIRDQEGASRSLRKAIIVLKADRQKERELLEAEVVK